MSIFADGRGLRALFLGATFLAASSTSSHAGPCTAQIAQVQVQVNDKADTLAGAGRTAPESTSALRHQQPTPNSVASAEESLGEGTSVEKALAALERAREADRAGNAAICKQDLAEARRVIGR
jgi:hypothetical protein